MGLLAKHWTVGRVKTRLATAIGAPLAADLHRAMVAYMLRHLADVAGRRVLAVAPDHQGSAFVGEAGWRWQITGQGQGDLGVRMQRLQRLLLSAGGNAVLVGSDCPQLTSATVERGLAQLQAHDVVMGPAADGGYYLIGLREPWQEAYAALFENVAWGTSAVAEQTRRAAAAEGLTLAELEVQHDVDRPGDLPRLVEWLRNGGGDAEFRQTVLALSAQWSITSDVERRPRSAAPAVATDATDAAAADEGRPAISGTAAAKGGAGR